MPCDAVILWTSDADGGAYTQTANLDGETDLKARSAPFVTQQLGVRSVAEFNGEIECAAPNALVYQFVSRLRVGQDSDWVSLSLDNTLWQSTVLRNTGQAIAMTVYCGGDTKLGKNKGEPPVKWTRLDQLINRLTAFIFGVQIACVLAFATCGIVWAAINQRELWYLHTLPQTPWYEWLFIPIRFLLLNSLMIPISLKVTLDIIKFYYAQLVNWDVNFYFAEQDTCALAVSTSIGENLGQIDHVFTDKTGTLTENVMRFHRCSINGLLYPSDAEDQEATAIEDAKLLAAVANESSAEHKFMLALALCQGAVPEGQDDDARDDNVDDDDDDNDNNNNVALPNDDKDAEFIARNSNAKLPKASMRSSATLRSSSTMKVSSSSSSSSPPSSASNVLPEYESNSPDELALLEAAGQCGIVFDRRDRQSVGVSYTSSGRRETFDWLAELAFTSDRKRMSVLVRSRESGETWLYCKGADTVLQPLLAESEHNAALLATTAQHCDRFAGLGLRTLFVARRRVDAAECEQWLAQFSRAAAAMEGREAALEEANRAMERELELLGATAIEDKLQDGVPETIQLLRDAGIGVWMLTGDKYSTAVQIAVSCNLVSPSGGPALAAIEGGEPTLEQRYGLLPIEGATLAEVFDSLHARYDAWKAGDVPFGFSVIVRGATLALVLGDEIAAELFSELCLAASTVIACRVTPKQKSRVVEIAMRRGQLALAIGDGGNDVGMIQAADVGVGIRGLEGQQAARAADYAIGRFKHLGRLLLVHGRYAYKRTAWIAQYSFYKSMIICVMQIAFGFVSGFSGASFFDSFALTMYNIAFTNVYTVAMVLERDVEPDSAMRVPMLYAEVQAGVACTKRTFAAWTARALYQGAVIFLFTILAGADWIAGAVRPDASQQTLSTAAFMILLTLQALTIYVESHTLTLVNHALILLSYGGYWLSLYLLSHVRLGEWAITLELTCSPTFWLVNVLACAACLLPIVGYRVFVNLANPPLSFHVQHIERNRSPSLARQMLNRLAEANTLSVADIRLDRTRKRSPDPIQARAASSASGTKNRQQTIRRRNKDDDDDQEPLLGDFY